MGTIKNIKEGWSNYMQACKDAASLPEEVQKLADTRAEICKECPFLEKSGLFKFVNRLIPGAKPEDPKKMVKTKFKVTEETAKNSVLNIYEGYKCGKCGCGFPANVYAPDKVCPEGKW